MNPESILARFKEYLFSQDNKPSSVTVKNYLSDVNHFLRWYESYHQKPFTPQLITHGTIEAYKRGSLRLDDRGRKLDEEAGSSKMENQASTFQPQNPASSFQRLSSRSLERHLSSLRKFFKFLKLDGQISSSPFEMVNGKSSMVDADPYRLKDFKNYLYVYNASHLTIKNYIIDIRQFFTWAEEVLNLTLDNRNWKLDREAGSSRLENLASTFKHQDPASSFQRLSSKNVLSAITPSLLEQYKERLVNEGNFSPATVNRKLSSLRKYFAWAQAERLVSGISYDVSSIQKQQTTDLRKFAYNLQDEAKNAGLADTKYDIQNTKYSSFPPIRLLQKISKLGIFAFDEFLTLPFAKAFDKFSYLTWLAKGKPVFQKIQNSKFRIQNAKINGKWSMVNGKSLLGISNIPKEFYAPLEISTKYFPWYKKVWHSLRYKRPEWYKVYHSYPITHYFHFAILIIFMAVIGFGFYQSFVQKPTAGQPALAALPTAPIRILSFQGRLTDNLDNPISTPSALRFAIYNAQAPASGSALLWQEVDSVAPDQDGIFSILLGNAGMCPVGQTNPTGPCGIPDWLFASNSALFLGVSVNTTPEMTPRHQLATVAFAANSETLQGLPPITQSGAGTSNVVLALDSSGNLSIGGSANPTFQASGGKFTISGQPLLLTTNAGTNGNVQITPDGLGKVDLSKPIINSSISNNISTAVGSVEIDDLLSVLATSSGQSAFTLNQDSAGPLISASASGVAKFTVGNTGSLTSANYTNAGGIIYTQTSGLLAQTSAGATTDCLIGGPTPSFSSCAGAAASSTYWNQVSGALFPKNSTVDLLVGGQATTSAKFALININGTRGTQTASLSGSLVLDSSTASIQTTKNQLLTIGGDTTGNINISPLNGGAGSLLTVNAVTTTLNGTTTLNATSLATIDAAASLSLDSTTLTLGNGAAATIQTTTNGLTLDSGSNTLTIAATDTTLTASGLTTVSLGTSATINAGATALNLQADGTPDVNIAGGSGATGCTILNASGNLACSGAIYSTSTTGIQGYWQRTAGALSPTNITDDLLLGTTATATAQFSVSNIAKNQAVASLSGQLIVMPNNGWGGQVGIGTTAPLTLMHLVGPSSGGSNPGAILSLSPDNITSPTSTDKFGIQLTADKAGDRVAAIYNTATQTGNSWNQPAMTFWVSGQAIASRELMRIDGQTGNVGIGLTNPVQNLSVSGNTFGLGIVTAGSTGVIQTYTDSGCGAGCGVLTSDMVRYASQWNWRKGSAGGYINQLVLDNSNNLNQYNAAGSTVMNVLSPTGNSYITGGNVGIGTTAPTAPLEFSGNGANRKIVLLKDADNDYQFAGFGVNNLVFRYFVPSTLYDHVFYVGTSSTTATELLRIKSNGNVGIGTTAPDDKLHVIGQIRIDNDTSTTNKGCFRYNGTSNQIEYSNDCSVFQGFSSSTGGGWTDDGTVVRLTTSTDNVGIGATSIAAGTKLHLLTASGTNDYLRIDATLADQSAIAFNDTTNGQDIVLYRPGTTRDFRIYTTTAGDVVTVTQAGNVGIGTTEPTQKLEIVGTGSMGASVSATQNPFLTVRRTNAVGQLELAVANAPGNWFTTGVVAGDSIIRYQNNAGTGLKIGNNPSGSPYVTIDNSGNVGIGTTTIPKAAVGYAKLAIEGTNVSSAGPHVQYTTSADNYPVLQNLNWDHDNISFNFDSYYDGAWKSSDSGSNFQIYKFSDQLQFNYENGGGVAAGSTLTWSNGIIMSNTGNVGIGATAPSFRLDVVNNTAGLARFSFSNPDTSAYQQTDIRIGRGTNSQDLFMGTNYQNTQQSFIDNRSGGPLNFKYNGTDQMTILTNGNVGIGTTSPGALLDLNGPNAAQPVLYVHKTTNNGAAMVNLTASGGDGALYINNTGNYGIYVDNGNTILGATSGNVGIGTTAPTSLLHVNGKVTGKALAIFNETGNQDIFTASASGITKLRVLNAGTIQAPSFYDIDNTSYFLDPAATGTSLNVVGGITAGTILPISDNTYDLGSSPSARWKNLFLGGGSLHIQCKTTDSGCPTSQGLDYSLGINSAGTFGIGANLNSSLTPAVNITQGGNVGIATPSAQELLHVYGGNIRIDTNTDYNGLLIYSRFADTPNSTTVMLGQNSNAGRLQLSQAGTVKVDFNPRDGASSWINSGNFGIGTTAPAAKLEVVNNTTIHSLLRSTSSTGYTSLRLYNDQNSAIRSLEIDYSGSAYSGSLVTSGPTGESGSITTTGAFPLTFGTNNTMRMTISSGGNVGIGTTNPGYKLEVVDTAKAGLIGILTTGRSGGEYPSVGHNVSYTGTSGSYTYRVTDTSSMIRFNSGQVETFTAAGGTGGSAISFTTGPFVAQGGTTWTNGSDVRLKENIETLSVLDRLKDYRAVSFDWRQTGIHDVGTIAQELYNVFPETVLKGSDGTDPISSTDLGMWGVQYEKLGPIALQGVKELYDLVSTQQTQISSQSAILSNLSPDVYLTSTGSLNIVDQTVLSATNSAFTIPHYFTLNDALGNPIERVGAFAEAAIGNLRVGFLGAKQVITDTLAVTSENITINGRNIRDYIAGIVTEIVNSQSSIVNGSSIISPIASIDEVHTNLISPLAQNSNISVKLDNNQLSIINNQSGTGSAVATFDNQGNASLSGRLSANQLSIRENLDASEASISGTLRARKIIADQIEGLNIQSSTISANYITNNYYVSTPSATSNPFPTLVATSNQPSASSSATDGSLLAASEYISVAPFASELAYVDNLNANTATFTQGLMSFGPSSFSDVSVVGQLSIDGNLILAANSINVLGGDLQLQPLRQGGLSVMAGLFHIDTNGNIKVGGNAEFAKDVTIKGKLATNIISPIPGNDLTLETGNSKLEVRGASDSAILAINSFGDLIASGEATFSKLNLGLVSPAFALSNTEVIATGSAGTASIRAYQTQITIDNPLVTEKSLIYVTPKSNQVIYLMRQVPGVSFTVGVQSPTFIDIPFNWIIVN